jgi:hypothetical protein
MTAVTGSISQDDVDEFVRVYARTDGWRGAIGLYQSMLIEGESIKALAASHPLKIPALAVGSWGGPFTVGTLSQVVDSDIESVQLDGIGHYGALEAPQPLAGAILSFTNRVDAS